MVVNIKKKKQVQLDVPTEEGEGARTGNVFKSSTRFPSGVDQSASGASSSMRSSIAPPAADAAPNPDDEYYRATGPRATFAANDVKVDYDSGAGVQFVKQSGNMLGANLKDVKDGKDPNMKARVSQSLVDAS